MTDWKFLFALAVFLVAALTTSQSTATRTIVPIGLAAGLAPGIVTGMWAGALGGVYTLPANGTQIAAANFDLSGTTKLGTKLIDHSFFIPMLVLSVTTIAVGARHRRGLLLSRSIPPSTPNHRPNGAADADAADRRQGCRPDAGPDRGPRAARGSIPSVAFPGYPAEPVDGDGRGDAADVPGRRLHQRPAHGRADRLPAHLRRDPGTGGLTGRDALRALRRAAGPAGAGLDDRPVDGRPARTTAGSTGVAPPTTRAGW